MQKLEASQKLEQNKNKAAEDEAARLKAEADIKILLSDTDDKNYNDLSNKEVLDIVATAFDTAMEARTKLATSEIDAPLNEINKKIDSLQQYLLKKEAASGIEAARGKFKDFDDYKEDISAIFEKYPGIAVSDAYVLAKGNKVADEPPQSELETERPINLGTRASEAQDRHDKAEKNKKADTTISSRRNFRNLLAEAVEKVTKNRKQ